MLKEMQLNKMKWFSNLMFFLIITFPVIVGLPLSRGAEKPYPNRPINLILGMTAGGPADIGSRVVADKMEEFWGVKIISVYKPGGGGALGASLAAKAKPDGYTMLVGSTSPLILIPLLKKTDYKMDDFINLGAYAGNPQRLHVKADARWKTLKDFVEEARKFPEKLTVGSYGKQTVAHFTIAKLCKCANIKLNHVPFRGNAELLPALLGGHVDAAITIGQRGFCDSPLIRVLAVAAEKRMEDWLDVPTFVEFGYPIEYEGLFLYSIPKETPKGIIDKLAEAQKKVYERHSREIKENFRKVAFVPMLLTPEETNKKLKETHDDLVKILSELGIKPE